MENIFSTRSSKTLIEISKIVQFKKLFESQLNLKLFSRQYLLKASLINCISILLWIINLHFIGNETFKNYFQQLLQTLSTFNIYPILRAACVKIAYVFSSMAISSRDSQVQKRWRLVGTLSAHLSRPRFENKTNCLVSSLFSRSSFPLFLSLFLPPLLPFSPWPSAVATRVHYTRDAPREGGEKGSYLICFPSGPLHRYRPHTFSFGLGARQGGSERIIGIREMEEDEEEEEEELPGLEGEAVRTVLHEFLLIRTSPPSVLSPLLIDLPLLGQEIDSPKPGHHFPPPPLRVQFVVSRGTMRSKDGWSDA